MQTESSDARPSILKSIGGGESNILLATNCWRARSAPLHPNLARDAGIASKHANNGT
jgi:hypothetical protein